ncbi:hypothetical protein KOW79_019011 [Hemibagrus wyckioides]|uniref:Uncharacterized protein n=1 Tax=Hemibagrus wyckioides TaxID=337641 RepID=A0A9D3SB18_9TELE|nr:hypothetical protein KOW79_019011 [Hemibagrus wyckioides]
MDHSAARNRGGGHGKELERNEIASSLQNGAENHKSTLGRGPGRRVTSRREHALSKQDKNLVNAVVFGCEVFRFE